MSLTKADLDGLNSYLLDSDLVSAFILQVWNTYGQLSSRISIMPCVRMASTPGASSEQNGCLLVKTLKVKHSYICAVQFNGAVYECALF